MAIIILGAGALVQTRITFTTWVQRSFNATVTDRPSLDTACTIALIRRHLSGWLPYNCPPHANNIWKVGYINLYWQHFAANIIVMLIANDSYHSGRIADSCSLDWILQRKIRLKQPLHNFSWCRGKQDVYCVGSTCVEDLRNSGLGKMLCPLN